jgi:hypothetical protein
LRISGAVVPLLLVMGVACERELIDIPAGPQQLVVHGVLNPADTMQIVLIERTLTGAVGTPIVLPFTTEEPISSDWGVPEGGVTTQITAPDGTVTMGTEYVECYQVPERLCRSTGAGKYKFFLRGSSLVPGGTYTFHAVTTRGEVIDAETIIPETPLAATTTAATFNRSIDTLALSWATTPRAPAYQVRVDNPTAAAWSSFTDSTRIALTGALRNPDEARLPRVFLPGVRQLLTVTAIDANMYDYYRTSNNSFVGYGAVSRVEGAYGVFGSAVTVVQENVTVTANQTLPIEGTWDAIDNGLGYVYFTNHLTLYVESAAAKQSEADAITGNYYNLDPSVSSPMTGTFKDGRLTLAMGTGLTAETLAADLRGDTLVGSYSKGAPARFVKRRSP